MTEIVYCSFCEKPNTEVLVMVASRENNAAICNECIQTSAQLVADHFKKVLSNEETTIS